MRSFTETTVHGNVSATWNKLDFLTHWGRVTHICVSKPTTIGSDNGLSPGRRQAIICTNAGIILIGVLGTNFSEILIEIYTFSFKKMHLKKLAAILFRPQCVNIRTEMHLIHKSWYIMSHFELNLFTNQEAREPGLHGPINTSVLS